METTTPTTAETVARIVAELLGLPRVPEPTEALDSLGANSLDLVELSMIAEEEMNIDLSDADLDGILTVGDLADLCDKARAS